MSEQLLIDGSRPDQTQVALIGSEGLTDFEYESKLKRNLKGNIYLAKVSRIEASLQAAFVDIGNQKNGFLAFGEIHPNYFQIPVADKESLIAAERETEEDHNKENEEHLSNEEEINEVNPELKESGKKTNSDENDDLNNLNDNKAQSPKKKYQSSLKRKLYRSYKIQEVIKTGQLILVQVVKEERGNKGAALTSYISLAGKFSVLMPNSTKTKGISRKISTLDDRNKLKKIIDDLNIPTEMGLIIRTAGLNKTKNEIKKDYSSLHTIWVNIVEATKKSIAPALIHEEGNLLRRVVRDVYTKEMKNIYVDGSDAFKETKKHMSQVLPSCVKFVKEYKNKIRIFAKHDVEKEIAKMFDDEVKLKSGGYIVINPTEALVAIDVNSGGATKERNIEKTALKTNIEAAIEIAKQIKIRDLSGLIVIDFIDMYEMRNNRTVEKKLKELIKKDRARVQTSRISQFGLLEMSRQRLRQSFIEWRSELSIESASLKAMYKIRENVGGKKLNDINVRINPSVAYFIKQNLINELDEIQRNLSIKIMFDEDHNLSNGIIEIIKIKTDIKIKKDKIIKKKKTNKVKTVRKKTKSATKKKNENKKTELLKNPIKEIKNKKSGWWQN